MPHPAFLPEGMPLLAVESEEAFVSGVKGHRLYASQRKRAPGRIGNHCAVTPVSECTRSPWTGCLREDREIRCAAADRHQSVTGIRQHILWISRARGLEMRASPHRRCRNRRRIASYRGARVERAVGPAREHL